MAGRAHQIEVKPETPGERGLPKKAVEFSLVTKEAVRGDFNVYRYQERNENPETALFLMPLQTLQQLNLEGWPIRPGDIGENITTSGIPY